MFSGMVPEVLTVKQMQTGDNIRTDRLNAIVHECKY